jgi:phosphoglycolate phosphatase
MNYTHIIWDFNGTILDDTDASIKSENVLLSRRNMPLIESRAHYHSLFCFPVIEYYKKLGHDFEKESYDELSVEWMEQYLIHSKASPLHDGVLDMLEKIRTAGIPQIILSATEISLLRSMAEALGISKYFSELLALDNIHAQSKIELAREWVSRTRPKKAVLIGDTIHDHEAACEMGVECVLVANGHQGRNSLTGCGVPVFDTLRELLESGMI